MPRDPVAVNPGDAGAATMLTHEPAALTASRPQRPRPPPGCDGRCLTPERAIAHRGDTFLPRTRVAVRDRSRSLGTLEYATGEQLPPDTDAISAHPRPPGLQRAPNVAARLMSINSPLPHSLPMAAGLADPRGPA